MPALSPRIARCVLLALAVLLPPFAALPAAAVDRSTSSPLAGNFRALLLERLAIPGLDRHRRQDDRFASPGELQGNVHLFGSPMIRSLQAIWNGRTGVAARLQRSVFERRAAAVNYAGSDPVAVTPKTTCCSRISSERNSGKGSSIVHGSAAGLAFTTAAPRLRAQRDATGTVLSAVLRRPQFSPLIASAARSPLGRRRRASGPAHLFGPAFGGELSSHRQSACRPTWGPAGHLVRRSAARGQLAIASLVSSPGVRTQRLFGTQVSKDVAP